MCVSWYVLSYLQLVTGHHTDTAHKNRGINGSPTQRDLKLLLDIVTQLTALFQEPPVILMYRMYLCNARMVTHVKCLCSQSVCSVRWWWHGARFTCSTVRWPATYGCCLLVILVLAVLHSWGARLTRPLPQIHLAYLPGGRLLHIYQVLAVCLACCRRCDGTQQLHGGCL